MSAPTGAKWLTDIAEVATASDESLRMSLLTLDGRSRELKTAAPDELLERAASRVWNDTAPPMSGVMAYKFNGGHGAVICDQCNKMIDLGIGYLEYEETWSKQGDDGDFCMLCKLGITKGRHDHKGKGTTQMHSQGGGGEEPQG